MIKYLDAASVQVLVGLAVKACHERGPEFYKWRESPEVDTGGWWRQRRGWPKPFFQDLTQQAAAEEFKAKLNGAYGERFMLAVAYAVAAVKAGLRVAIVQLAKEEGTAFDPQGWMVLLIEDHPFFHISPQDLPPDEVFAAGIVTVIEPDTEEAKTAEWKAAFGGEGKPREFELLLQWLVTNP